MSDRPDNACLTHRPPKPDQFWRLADPGYRTCATCADRIHKLLSPLTVGDDGRPDGIPGLYLLLDARPGVTESARRGPGFGSRSPGSDHILVMRDRRSKSYEIARDGVEYIWDPDADNGHPPLPPGVHGPERPPGAYVDKRDVWYGSDGKGYQEEETPARSVPHVLESWVQLVAEERGVKPGAGTVPDLCSWLDRHLDWLSRQELIADLQEELRELHSQLRAATGGAHQPPVGRCIELLADGECGAPIYMPHGETPRAPDEPIKDLPELVCQACGSRYTGRRLILLRLNSEKRAS